MELLMMAALCAFVPLQVDKPDEKQADERELVGVWIEEHEVYEGAAPVVPSKVVKLIFSPTGKMHWEVSNQNPNPELSYTTDASKKLKLLDATFEEGLLKGKTHQFLYRIEGDTLTLCGGLGPAYPRPTEFSCKKDSGQMLITFKREKK